MYSPLAAAICRTCMQDSSRYHRLDEYVEDKFRIVEMLDAIVPQINIKTTSQFSDLVCDTCLDKLLTGYKFQQLCIDTHKQLTALRATTPLESDMKMEAIWDPLMGKECFTMKEEFIENKCVEYESKCANTNNDMEIGERGEDSMDSNTDSSNEKLNILRERKLRKCSNRSKRKKSESRCLTKHTDSRQSDTFSATRDSINLKRKSTANQNRCRVRKMCEIQRQTNLRNQKSNTSGETDKTNNNILAVKTEIIDFQSLPDVKEEIDIMAPTLGDSMDDCNPHGDWFNTEDDFDNSTEASTLKRKSPKKPKHGKNTDFVDTGVGEVEKPSSRNRRNGHYPCEVCGKIFDRPYRLKRHRSVHSLDKPYECEICKCRFTSTSYLKAHKLLHNIKNNEIISSSAEGYKCPDCPRRFEKQASLSAHRQIHTRDAFQASYACTNCQCIFTNVKSLTEHITNKHPEVEKFKCDQCDKIFVLHAHLVEHLNRHKGNKNLVCVICEKEFGFMNSLKEHMRTHNGESPYLCPQCGKTFRNASNLRQHMERHSGLKKYHCPECPSRFNCRSDLKKHVDTHTSTKSHECDICASRFTRSYSLQKHKRLHSGKRPFKCDQCNMTFSLLYHLKRHIRTHTGEKPYKCKYCERAYAESGDLNKHLRTHLGENTYMCEKCPMAFKYQLELRQHLSIHYKMTQNQIDSTEEQMEHVTNISSHKSSKTSFDLVESHQTVTSLMGKRHEDFSIIVSKVV